MGLLEGKKAIITGGSRGIGRSLCEVFAREGADIAFNYNVSDERAVATVKEIESMGRRALSFKVSVTDRPGMIKMTRKVHEEFGRIDILVNNAAINRGDNFATMTERAWDEVIDTNVNGLFNATKPVFKFMMRQRSGYILNLSSVGAHLSSGTGPIAAPPARLRGHDRRRSPDVMRDPALRAQAP